MGLVNSEAEPFQLPSGIGIEAPRIGIYHVVSEYIVMPSSRRELSGLL